MWMPELQALVMLIPDPSELTVERALRNWRRVCGMVVVIATQAPTHGCRALETQTVRIHNTQHNTNRPCRWRRNRSSGAGCTAPSDGAGTGSASSGADTAPASSSRQARYRREWFECVCCERRMLHVPVGDNCVLTCCRCHGAMLELGLGSDSE